MKKPSSERGFTLMELMVVIVIVAILAAVAVPLYINYVKDAKRTEGKGAIAAVISAEQIHFQNEGTYVDGDVTAGTSVLKVDLTEVARNWDVTVSGATDDQFTVTADGKDQADGLSVCCTYFRTQRPVWAEDAACGGGGGP